VLHFYPQKIKPKTCDKRRGLDARGGDGHAEDSFARPQFGTNRMLPLNVHFAYFAIKFIPNICPAQSLVA
jgi:hypothetical protein